MINFVNGIQSNVAATDSLRSNIMSIRDKYEGTVHFGFALSELDHERIIIDALIVTKEKGILAVKFSSGDSEKDLEELDKIYVLLENILKKNQGLRARRNLAISINVIVYCVDSVSGEEDFINENQFIKYYEEELKDFDEAYYASLNEALDKIVSAKPKKLRSNIKKADSYGAKMKEIEKQIANMDEWQKEAAYELPEKPQRIRGLAGSGKTVVLALKAAYLHFIDKEKDIAVTFYSRSLYEQYLKLIDEFYMQYSGGEHADFEKIHLLHSWGSSSEPGLYSKVAKMLGYPVYTYNEAAGKFGRDKAFQGACDDLVSRMDLNSVTNLKMYDYILIDEAQDLPASFFRMAYRLFKDQNKHKLVFAYDELQTLGQASMPSFAEMFGVDESGQNLVDLDNKDEVSPKTDILLPVCYRNTKWALTIAHALGFGIYRQNVEQPLVQFFEDLSVWEKIGYEVVEGKLEYGSKVRLIRKNSPSYFDELLDAEDSVKVIPAFGNKDEEYAWIAKQIKKNIEEDELDPDDILVIFPDPYEAKRHYVQLSKVLRKVGIESIMPDVNVDRDTFTRKGCITCTHIFRAKGNEKPMVYLADAEYGSSQESSIVKVRNILFTAITRSRAWTRITGTGTGLELIEEEIRICKEKGYSLEINIPTEDEIRRLNLLNKDSTKNMKKIKAAEKATEELIQFMSLDNVKLDDIPGARELLIQLLEAKKRDS